MPYHIYIKDITANTLTEIPYDSIQVVEELNKGKQATISVSYDALKAASLAYGQTPQFLIAGALREVIIEKGTTRIYYGVITDFSLQENQNGSVSASIASVGFSKLLSKRRTGVKRVFANTDAGIIAWTIINESQQSDLPYSDFGITQGLIQTSVQRDRTFRFANIKDEIEQMSNTNLYNGFDFEINDQKQFNVYYPQKGQARANIVLDEHNLLPWRYRIPLLLGLTNKLYVVGNGFNDDVLYVTRQSSNEYKQTFRLLEDLVSERDVITTNTLNDKGDKFLLDHQSPRVELQLTHLDGDPSIEEYEVGDSLRVSISKLEINDVYKRVYKRQIQIVPNQAVITLEVK